MISFLLEKAYKYFFKIACVRLERLNHRFFKASLFKKIISQFFLLSVFEFHKYAKVFIPRRLFSVCKLIILSFSPPFSHLTMYDLYNAPHFSRGRLRALRPFHPTILKTMNGSGIRRDTDLIGSKDEVVAVWRCFLRLFRFSSSIIVIVV